LDPAAQARGRRLFRGDSELRLELALECGPAEAAAAGFEMPVDERGGAGIDLAVEVGEELPHHLLAAHLRVVDAFHGAAFTSPASCACCQSARCSCERARLRRERTVPTGTRSAS